MSIRMKKIIYDAEMCIKKLSSQQIQRKQKNVLNLENKVSQYMERMGAVTEHLRNVQQERTHTQVKK